MGYERCKQGFSVALGFGRIMASTPPADAISPGPIHWNTIARISDFGNKTLTDRFFRSRLRLACFIQTGPRFLDRHALAFARARDEAVDSVAKGCFGPGSCHQFS
jgi:hypothetical protein